jgi:hypothetical protein
METKIKRPTFDENMLAELAEHVGSIINEHCTYKDHFDCVEDAKTVLEWNYNSDGYGLAKEFENKGYEGSTELANDLDCVSSEYDNILNKAVRNWVKENDIKLDLMMGTKVIIDAWRKNNEEGEIVALYPETAQYGVWVESINKPKGKSHYLINFEKIKSVVECANSACV